MGTTIDPILDALDDELPRIVPPGFDLVAAATGGRVYRATNTTMAVILSAHRESDGKRWMHLSCSRPSRLPSWEDLRRVKDAFIGADRIAVQVLPRKRDYYNLHPYVLHLWCCLDGDPVPDFKAARGGVV